MLDNVAREQLKLALEDAAVWLVESSERKIPLKPNTDRCELLSTLVVCSSGTLTGGDLAAFFAGAATDRQINSLTAEDIKKFDDALVELNWFMPLHLTRKISMALHPHARILRIQERIAC